MFLGERKWLEQFFIKHSSVKQHSIKHLSDGELRQKVQKIISSKRMQKQTIKNI